MEGFLVLIAAWIIVFLATRKSSSHRGISKYEKERIRRSNKRLITEEKKLTKKLKDEIYDLLWGPNKYL